MKPFFFLWLLLAILTGCASTPDTRTRPLTQRPSHSQTAFTPALRCMDSLLVSAKRKPMTLVSDRILGHPSLQPLLKDMVIHAIKQMSTRSKAIQYIDYDPMPGSPVYTLLNQMIRVRGFRTPDFYLRGSVSGELLDEMKLSGAASQQDWRASLSHVNSSDRLMLNLNLGEFISDGQLISPQIKDSASYTLMLNKSKIGARLSGNVWSSLGLSMSIGLNESDSQLLIFQSLIELATIELIGKELNLPYWSCLQLDATEPAFQQRVADWYESSSRRERVTFVQQKLKDTGFYFGNVDGKYGRMTQMAISTYQLKRQLIPNGRLSLNLFMTLSTEPKAAQTAQQSG